MQFSNKKAGFTLVEILVALLLLSTVAFIAGAFVLPLRLTSESQTETRAVTYARSYLELVKVRWLSRANYLNASGNWSLPTATSASTADIQLPTGWTLTVAPGVVAPLTAWTTADTLRTVVVTVTPSTQPTRPVTISTQIAL